MALRGALAVTLTKEQHATLSAMDRGGPHTLWPMMRRALLRAGYIAPNGPPPTPSETKRRVKPVRAYVVTQAGRDAIAAYPGPDETPHHEQYPRILFGGAAE